MTKGPQVPVTPLDTMGATPYVTDVIQANHQIACVTHQFGWTLCGRPKSSIFLVPGDSRSMIP